ncbi:MAG TPA: hypothetical protein VD927_09900 [Chryseosolibacter sp.]|nr:hypothetical protein [Chryseosolibacter sp.]
MKAAIIIFSTITTVHAQLAISPYVGLNSTRMNDTYGYINGGNYFLAGADVEYEVTSKDSDRKLRIAIGSGVSYLRNGFYSSNAFSLSFINSYRQTITDLSMVYWQAPLLVRFNWQPFTLIEDWKVFAGGGAVFNFLQKAQMREEYTEVFYSADALAPPPSHIHFSDDQNVTPYAVRQSVFTRFELGMKYKKMHLSYRVSVSKADLYFSGIEDHWQVPAEYSDYIQRYAASGKIKEKHAEIIIGYRLGKLR